MFSLVVDFTAGSFEKANIYGQAIKVATMPFAEYREGRRTC
jgi:hypothetical protein